MAEPILHRAAGLVKRYGRVTALDHADFDLMPGEILGGHRRQRRRQVDADQGDLRRGHARRGRDPARRQAGPFHARRCEARAAGIETVYQNLALSPALSIADNLFLGRELPQAGLARATGSACSTAPAMEKVAREQADRARPADHPEHQPGGRDAVGRPAPGRGGGARRRLRRRRSSSWTSRRRRSGVKESRKVLELILDVQQRGLPIVLISHNMPHVFEVADRIHIHRLGRRIA